MLLVFGLQKKSSLKYRALHFTSTRFKSANVERSTNKGFPCYWNLKLSISQPNEQQQVTSTFLTEMERLNETTES